MGLNPLGNPVDAQTTPFLEALTASSQSLIFAIVPAPKAFLNVLCWGLNPFSLLIHSKSRFSDSSSSRETDDCGVSGMGVAFPTPLGAGAILWGRAGVLAKLAGVP